MRLSRYEKNYLRALKRKNDLKGSGLFVYRNNTSGELYLPRPTRSGQTRIEKNAEFQGDNYYMFMVTDTRELRLVRTIEPVNKPINESVDMNENKLITEQPPVITEQGTVEYVQGKNQPANLQENAPVRKAPDILLNENPLDGVEII